MTESLRTEPGCNLCSGSHLTIVAAPAAARRSIDQHWPNCVHAYAAVHFRLRQYVVVALLAGLVGCAQPLRVDTRANVDATGNLNVNATGNVKAELAPTPFLQPVTAMGLPIGLKTRKRPKSPSWM